MSLRNILIFILVMFASTAGAVSWQELLEQGSRAQRSGNYVEAEQRFRQALELQPDNAQVYVALGNLLRQQEKIPQAIAMLSRAIELAPDNASAHIYLALARYERVSDRRELGLVIDGLRQGISLDPRNGLAYYYLGALLSDQGNLEEAIAAYRTALELGERTSLVYYYLGNTLSDQGNLEEAIAAYRQALSLPDYPSHQPAPVHAMAHNGIGEVLLRQGQVTAAAREFQSAVGIAPRFFAAWHNLSEIQKLRPN
jgi:superkiller protein 3